MQVLLVNLLLIIIAIDSEALSCGLCNAAACKQLDRYQCPNGITKDECRCCNQCMKGVGEGCGGLWGTAGKCASNLDCVIYDHNMQSGTCSEKSS